MICFPNSKINIGLNIVSRRSDGFHNLETLFYPVGLHDVLEFVPLPHTGQTRFQATGIELDSSSSNNLVMKAFELLKQAFELPPLHIHLHKNIPFGAGLGGGSADAAFMLKLLNEHFALGLSPEKLESYASHLGSDCAFFISNRPAFATGRGEKLSPFALDLSNYFIALVFPGVHVSTAVAYRGVVPHQPVFSLRESLQKPIAQWKHLIVNDFEQSVLAKHPEIASVKEKLYARGAEFAAMSGSGSAVFGIFSEKPDLKKVFPHFFVCRGSALHV